MTRLEAIEKLEEIKEQIACLDNSVTDYACEKSYICISAAIDYLKENEEE